MPDIGRPPLRIGLTGGIGSGKSAVAASFAALGTPVIDADEIAHRLTRPGGPAVAPILAAFGPDIASDSGIDRRLLAERVFQQPGERHRLEAILHPLIRAEMIREAEALSAPYCILVIPLLVEAGQHDLVDRVLVVDVEERLQLERVRTRDGRSDAEIRAILAAQASRAERLRAADDVITNDSNLAALDRQVEELHRRYLSLAAEASRHSTR